MPADITCHASACVCHWQRRNRVASWQKAVRWLVRLGRRIVVEQRQRRAIRQLQALDDRMLADIGLRRGEIESAARGVTMS